MASDQIKRKLAAILAADIAGYSRLMGADEAGTFARLKEYRRELIDPKNKQYRGRVVKTTGDGILMEFPSVVDAVSAAIEVQRGMRERNADIPPEKRIEFRIGINLGDVIIEGRDLYGDGVNIAARLEGLAEPGGICISQTVFNHTCGKITFDIEDLGEQHLKNIAQSVRVYRIVVDPARRGTISRAQAPALALPDKPSIAVLPFQNMSGDPTQEYFADGVVEDIITALSRFQNLFVIARNSSFTYKGRAVDVKQVGRELGVRYILEGSVRKAANRARIVAQLIEATTAMHLWADRFEGTLEDIFELQDQVTASVVGALAPRLERAEIERTKRKSTDSLHAYDYFMRGLASAQWQLKESNSEALGFFYRAIELDPDFASAYGMAAWCYVWRKSNRWMTDRAQESAEGARLARRAADLGKDDGVALSRGGFTLAYIAGNLDDGAAFIDRALMLNPNLAAAWYFSGWVRAWLSEPDVSIEHLRRAMRLSPLDPLMALMWTAVAFAHFLAGRYDEASSWAAMALRENPTLHSAIRIAAATNAMTGRLKLAQEEIVLMRQLDPTLCVSNLADVMPFRRPEDLAKYSEALRIAGLPD
jgi:adenylate cyclase